MPIHRSCHIALLVFVAIIGLTGCGHSGGGSSSDADQGPVTAAERMMFGGAGDLGIFDPAVSHDPVTDRLWMSYSSVNSSLYYSSSQYWKVSIRLAFSDDNGASWQDAGVEIAPSSEQLLGPITATPAIPVDSPGIWQSETSALIYDPGADANERWKLIWFQYLNANLTPYYANFSWIALKMAATPQELASATPIKLFGGAGLLADGSNTGAPVFSPIAGNPAIQLNIDLSRTLGGASLTDLSLCIFAEPGLHATSSALYLTIYCADASTTPITEYLVYFRCGSPCNITTAASWEYLGRLLTPADGQAATGNHHYQAPALVTSNGKTYLLATPVDTSVGDRYNGCRLYELVDVDSNQLRRASGKLVEVARVDGVAGSHNGACAAFPGLDGGLLLSQFQATATAETFRIFKSQVELP
jgi:hypothetical protein